MALASGLGCAVLQMVCEHFSNAIFLPDLLFGCVCPFGFVLQSARLEGKACVASLFHEVRDLMVRPLQIVLFLAEVALGNQHKVSGANYTLSLESVQKHHCDSTLGQGNCSPPVDDHHIM